MCKYCENVKEKGLKGVTLNDKTLKYDDARLFIDYGDYSSDDKNHYYLCTEGNHIDAYVEIKYCPMCGKKLKN